MSEGDARTVAGASAKGGAAGVGAASGGVTEAVLVGVRDGVSVREAGGLALARQFARGFTKYGIVVSSVLLFVALTFLHERFLTEDNLVNVLQQNAPVGIIAITLTVVMLGGDLDFSGGAVFGFAGVVATLTVASLGAWPALALGILVGVGLGLINGLLVAYGGIDSFIATLATGIMVAGLSLVATGGSLISADNVQFAELGRGTLFGMQYVAWIFLAGGAVLSFLMATTRPGRYVYATGDNREAARLSGIPTRAIRAGAFALAGCGAALAGVIITSQTSQAQPQVGLELVVAAIAAVVVGGTRVSGGRGAVWRTVLGVLFLAMIANGLNLLAVAPIYQQILFGGIILAAVFIDRVSRGR